MSRTKNRRTEDRRTPEDFKRRREGMGCSQVDLAELMGVTQQTISQWETGKHRIPTMAWKLLRYVEITLLGQ